CPAPYTSAVSKKVTPSSSPRRSAATDSSSSTSPQPSAMPSAVAGPPIAQHPNPTSLTSMPLRPSTLPIPIPFHVTAPVPAPGLRPAPGQWSKRTAHGTSGPPYQNRRQVGQPHSIALHSRRPDTHAHAAESAEDDRVMLIDHLIYGAPDLAGAVA